MWSEAQLRSWCIQEVARCDLYIGLFWHRYGSLDQAARPMIAWAEVEYWEAVRRGKARLLYLFTDSPHPHTDHWQRHLSALVKLTGASAGFARLRRIRRMTYLDSLQRDVDDFGRTWPGHALVFPGVTPPSTPSPPKVSPETPYWRASTTRFDADALQAGVDQMKLLYGRAAYIRALATGVGVLSKLLYVPPEEDPRSTELWLGFLTEWDRAGSWIGVDGIVPDDMDTLWACRKRVALLGLLGRTRQMYGAAGNVATALYRRGKVRRALYWLDMSARDVASVQTPAALSTRASMLISIRQWREAEILLKRAVDTWARQGPVMSLAKDLAKIGLIEARLGHKRGLTRIEEAMRLASPKEHPGFAAQTLGYGVEAALSIGDRDAATAMGREFIALCEEHHLLHQLSGLKKPLAKLGIPVAIP